MSILQKNSKTQTTIVLYTNLNYFFKKGKMEALDIAKRKVRLFWSKDNRKKNVLTSVTVILLLGVFAYSFLYTHLEQADKENTFSMFDQEQELTGFAVRGETAERTAAASEEVGITEAATIETAPISTTQTITRQSSTTMPSTGSSSTVSRTAPNAVSRTSSAKTDSSISRIVSPTKVTRETGTTAGEKTITRTPAKPAVIRTSSTFVQSFESVKTETVQRKSAVVIQRTAPSLTKAPITISRKPVTELGEETVQKIEEAVKKNEENPELPAVKQVLEISPEKKGVTLVLAINPSAKTIAPKMSVAVNKLPTEKYKPRLNQPWNPLGLFNAMAYGKKTVKAQSFSTGNDQSIIAQQFDISSLEKGEYEVFTQLTDEGNILSSDRTDFSNKGKE